MEQHNWKQPRYALVGPVWCHRASHHWDLVWIGNPTNNTRSQRCRIWIILVNYLFSIKSLCIQWNLFFFFKIVNILSMYVNSPFYFIFYIDKNILFYILYFQNHKCIEYVYVFIQSLNQPINHLNKIPCSPSSVSWPIVWKT